MIVFDDHSGGEIPGIDVDFFPDEIDLQDFPAQNPQSPTESTDRINDMAWCDRGTSDFCEHGLEDHVVLLRNNDRLFGQTSGLFQGLCDALAAIDARKSSAEDRDFEFHTTG